MRKLVLLLSSLSFVFAAACAPTTQPPESPRPSAASGGFRAAEQPKTDAWVSLGAPVETAPSQHTIVVNGSGGKVGALMIKGVAGEAEIEQITIEYMDEQSKRVDLGKKFMPGDAQVIELREDRVISKIVVFLDPDSKGTFEIFGA